MFLSADHGISKRSNVIGRRIRLVSVKSAVRRRAVRRGAELIMFVNDSCEPLPVERELKNKIDTIGFWETAIVTTSDIFKGKTLYFFRH